ncbi:hypothetical protein DRO97_03810 [Archaeoglobales archaeon]|nr:MAG: hypothetical protein DRO97_03810 [Archaeoglobales archaeon]
MLIQKSKIEDVMEFVYSYLILKSYFFKIKTKIIDSNYPNSEFVEKCRDLFRNSDFKQLLKKAFKGVKKDIDGDCLDFLDALDKSAYFALIHPNHPNITLGFVKDADLWDIWLNEGVFKIVREVISDKFSISSGDKIIDFGCGSASPLYFGSMVGSTGLYTGIDYSEALIKIAETRKKRENFDRVNLIKNSVETKLQFRRKYDFAICSSILQYVDIKAVLSNILEALKYEGTIAIFSGLFRDIELEKTKLLEIYYSLIPSFKRFPELSKILEVLDNKGVAYKYKLVDNNLLKIDVRGV